MYSSRMLMYVRTVTPSHVGIGRGYGVHVDLPVQRDEFGFPCIWSSSLKGAIKSWFPGLRPCLGPDPGELEVAPLKQSSISFTDAKLVLIPARVVSGVYTYVTSPHLLDGLARYLQVAGVQTQPPSAELLEKLDKGIALASTDRVLYKGRLIVNELEIPAEHDSGLLEKLKVKDLLPTEVLERVSSKGLVLIPDSGNSSLTVVNRSMLIQYRVRLNKETKTVDAGPWSEEFVPAETVLASLALCAGSKASEGGEAKCPELLKSEVNNKVVFVGGKETVGRGLVKFYVYPLG